MPDVAPAEGDLLVGVVGEQELVAGVPERLVGPEGGAFALREAAKVKSTPVKSPSANGGPAGVEVSPITVERGLSQ